jgi:hypothetical protein
MEGAIGLDLAAVLAGDVERMAIIESSAHELLTAIAVERPLLLSRDAVVRVLRRYSAGQIGAADVQVWASFMRWGYVGSGGEPVRPLDIVWEPAYETAISYSPGSLMSSEIWSTGRFAKEAEDLLDALALGDQPS